MAEAFSGSNISRRGRWVNVVLKLILGQLVLLSILAMSKGEGARGNTNWLGSNTAVIVNSMNNTLHVTDCGTADIAPLDHLQVSTDNATFCTVEELDDSGNATGCTVSIDLTGRADLFFIRPTGVFYMGARKGKSHPWNGDGCPIV